MTIGEADLPVLAVLPDANSDNFDVFLDEVRRSVRAGDAVLVGASVTEYGAEMDWGLQALTTAIDACAGVTLSDVGGTSDISVSDQACLVATPEFVRFACSYATHPPPAFVVKQSFRARTDYRAFEHLWAPGILADVEEFKVNFEERDDETQFRAIRSAAIGRTIGLMVQKDIPMVLTDAHTGNFGLDEDLTAVILESIGYFTYRALTPAEWATGLVPLMAESTPVEWQMFLLNFIEVGGEKARRIVGVVEAGDLTGWLEPLENGDYGVAAERLQQQLDTDRDMNALTRVRFLDLLSMCLLRSGHTNEAVQALRELKEVGYRVIDSTSDAAAKASLTLRLAKGHLGTRDFGDAIRLFRDVIEWEAVSPTDPKLLSEARALLAFAQTQAQDPEERQGVSRGS